MLPKNKLIEIGQSLRVYCQSGEVFAIPPEYMKAMNPATHCFYEWSDYLIEYEGADRLRVGENWIEPAARNLFQLRFENNLGLTVIQPFAEHYSLCEPLHVEVISRKFPSLADHVSFYRALLDDLFNRAARLPFTITAPTARRVAESVRPPTPLFIYHFLCQHAARLRLAITIIQAAPQRRLAECPAFVPLSEASEADPEVLISILHAPEELARSAGFPLAARLRGYAPSRVWQRRPEETSDTPENRFAREFLQQVMNAADSLISERWWGSVPADRKRLIRELGALLRDAARHPVFAEAGPMQHLPASSQALMRRKGYRDLLALWQVFNHARRPLFEPLEQAINLRDVAQLYEMWAFFALVGEIAVAINESPVIELRLSDESGLGRHAEARFGSAGRLAYNEHQGSYSVPLRPDFTWKRAGQAVIALDAKFRLERGAVESSEDTLQSTARRDDLYKMHAYRDALGLRAAVSIYPGDVSIFYESSRRRVNNLTLPGLFRENLSGVGALAMSPDRQLKEK